MNRCADVTTDGQNAGTARSHSTEAAVLRKRATIICDHGRSPVSSQSASVQAGEWHDATGHHRYYGSSACNGGERMAETRRGPRPPFVNLFGF